ncbi:Os01g0962900 [Oryza sativa Japonica Group]|uniref:Peroxidase n=1 Tax=Oryza sativa subsp. japonica TaxID=39947 RepID=Q0JFT2_ORYSJ|nr:Os01g0962900 [Oryza sativa Japonica Group]|eukprot:NP_001045482.2 Os01g0962900 [Oryza sativa Japonica Group]
MARKMSSTLQVLVVSCCSLLLLCAPAASAGDYPPTAKGLSYGFYQRSCPKAETIVRSFLKKAIRNDGCDASVLLARTATEASELDAPPNETIRPSALMAVAQLRALLDDACSGAVVSCADILTLAARDSVRLVGGPEYRVPLGRRDGATIAARERVVAAFPPPSSNVTALLAAVAKIGLDAADLVALSGAHTLGVSRCISFDDRLFPQVDATMDARFAAHLRLSCPAKNTTNTTAIDVRTPNAFDNKYYVDLLSRQGLLTSDQVLFSDGRTRGLVGRFAVDQPEFFRRFAFSMVKMSQIQVMTGVQGEIRTNCSVRNAAGGGT